MNFVFGHYPREFTAKNSKRKEISEINENAGNTAFQLLLPEK